MGFCTNEHGGSYNMITKIHKIERRKRKGGGMGMANQLGHNSVYACCSTRATKSSMEGGDNVPYGRQISGQRTGPYLDKIMAAGSKYGKDCKCKMHTPC